jgi:epoxyqueuosine reductase QueG
MQSICKRYERIFMPDRNLLQKLIQQYQIPAFGIIPYSAVSDHLIPCRAMNRIPPNAKTVILMLFPYYTAPFPERNLSLYAVVPDYHAVVGEILTTLAAACSETFGGIFAPFTDSSPIPEVEAAAKAGLGVIGKNGLLLHETYGSYCFIGELVTDLDFDAAEQPIRSCIDCGACAKHCPGKVIAADTRDYSRCLSAITQKKKTLTEDEEAAITANGFVWGCDHCQEVCPYNKQPVCTPFSAFSTAAIPVITEENVEALFADRAFAWRGKAVIRRNLALIQKDK